MSLRSTVAPQRIIIAAHDRGMIPTATFMASRCGENDLERLGYLQNFTEILRRILQRRLRVVGSTTPGPELLWFDQHAPGIQFPLIPRFMIADLEPPCSRRRLPDEPGQRRCSGDGVGAHEVLLGTIGTAVQHNF